MPERLPDRPEHHRNNPSLSSRSPGGSSTLRHRPSTASRVSRSSHTARKRPQQPLAGAVRPGRDHRRAAPRAGRRAARARPRTGRPWTAEVVVHQRGVDAGLGGDRPHRGTLEARARRRARAPRPGSPRACPVRRAGVRGWSWTISHAGSVHSGQPRAAAKCSRLNASASSRSASRASRSPALRVLISTTMWPSNPRLGEQLEERSAGLVAVARDQVLVLGRPAAVGHVHVPQPVAEPLGHLDRVGLRRWRRGTGRWWCWRRTPRTGPSRVGRPSSRAARWPATGTCSRRRRRCRYVARGRRSPRRSRVA